MSIQIGNTADLGSYITNQQTTRERIVLQSKYQSNMVHLIATNNMNRSYILFDNNYTPSNQYHIGTRNESFIISSASNRLVTLNDQTMTIAPTLNIQNAIIDNIIACNVSLSNLTITSNLLLFNKNPNDLVFSIRNSTKTAPILVTYSSGSVGIGTTPVEMLHVNCNIRSDSVIRSPRLLTNALSITSNYLYSTQPNLYFNQDGDLVLKSYTDRIILDAKIVLGNLNYTSNLSFTDLELSSGSLYSTTFQIGPNKVNSKYVPYSLKIDHVGNARAIGDPTSNMVQMALNYQMIPGGPYNIYYPFQIDSVGRIGIGTSTPNASIDYYYSCNLDINSNGVLRIQGTNLNDKLIIDPQFRIGIGTASTLHNLGLYTTSKLTYTQSPSNVQVFYTSNIITSNYTFGNFATNVFTASNFNYNTSLNIGYGNAFSIASNASTLVVGAPNSNINQGTIYIYQQINSQWGYTCNITPTDLSSNAYFGTSIGLSSNATRIIVGAPGSNLNRGTAYIYQYNISGWQQQAKIEPPQGQSNHFIGSNVAMSLDGNTIVISAHGSNNNQGGAYVYRWVAPNWNQETLLTTRGESNLGLTMFVAQDGNTVLLPNATSNNSQGTVLGYKYFNNTWVSNKFTEQPFGGTIVPGSFFGLANAFSSNANVLAIGSPGSNLNQGAAYVYRWTTSWSASNAIYAPESNTSFGNPIAMSGDGNRMVIGAIGSNQNQGAAYVYQWNGTNWLQQTKLSASDGRPSDRYGQFINMSFDGNSIVITAPTKDVVPNSNQGASYLYTWSNVNWVETKLLYLNASSNNTFGQRPVFSGNNSTLVIGGSNAVYVFRNTSNTTSNLSSITSTTVSLSSNVTVFNTFEYVYQGSNAILGIRQSGISSNFAPYLYLTSNDIQVAQWDQNGRLTIGSTAPYSSNYSPSFSLQTQNPIITPILYTGGLLGLPGSTSINLYNAISFANASNISASNLSIINNITSLTSFTSNTTNMTLTAATATIQSLTSTTTTVNSMTVNDLFYNNSLRSSTFVSTPNYLTASLSNVYFNFTNNFSYTGDQGFLRLYAPNPNSLSGKVLGGTNPRLINGTGSGHISIRINTNTTFGTNPSYNYAATEYGVSTDGGVTNDTTGLTGYVGLYVDAGARVMHHGMLTQNGGTNNVLIAYDANRVYLGMTTLNINNATSIIENGNIVLGSLTQTPINGQNPKLYCNGILFVGDYTKNKYGVYIDGINYTQPRIGINCIPVEKDTIFTVNGSSTFQAGSSTFNSNVIVNGEATFNNLATFNNYIYSVRNVIVTSDSNLKTDLQVIDEPLTKIQQLSGYTYLRKDTHVRESGLIAQEVQRVLPEVIQTLPDKGSLGIAYGNMMGLMVEAIKELTQKVEQLTNRVQFLEKELGTHYTS